MDDQNHNYVEAGKLIGKQIERLRYNKYNIPKDSNIRPYPQYYSELFESPDNIRYIKLDPCDMGNFSSIIPFPEIILYHYTSALFKATFGCFPEIRRFYCTIDNKLFVWSIDSQEPEQIMEEKTNVICCACLCGVDPELFDNYLEFTHTLVLATPKYIRIIKVNGEKIEFNNNVTAQIDYAPSCIAAGPCGQIFIGADSGRIFLVKRDAIKGYITKCITYNYLPTDFTYGIFPRILRKLVGYTTVSITQIVFGSTFSYIAAIDANSHLRFFNYVYGSNSCTILSFQDSDRYQVASVCSVPAIDDSKPQFIAFCKDGTRLLIEKSHDSRLFGSGLTFAVVSQNPPPDLLGKDEVMCAQSFMGLTVMVCKEKVLFLRGQRYKDKDKNHEICEFVTSEKIADTGLSIGLTNSYPNWNEVFLNIDRAWFELNLNSNWTDPLVWQHHQEPPIVYILTAAGGYKYRFSTPSEHLSRLVISSKGYINAELEEYLGFFCKKYEPVVNSILASFQHPECDDFLIYMITQYAHKSFTDNEKLINKSIIVKGMAVRISRILIPVWDSVLFRSYRSKRGYIKWRVSNEFSHISPFVIRQLQHTIEWINKYLDNIKSNSETVIIKTSTLLSNEENDLKILLEFVKIIIEILSFLGFISIQKKQLTTELIGFFGKDREKEDQFDFLTGFRFSDCIGINMLSERHEYVILDFNFFLSTLKDFTYFIFTKIEPSNSRDIFAQQIIETCPSLSRVSNEEYQISEALNRLEAIRASDLPLRDKKVNFPFAVNPFIKYVKYINIENLIQIISKLVSMEGISESIQIIEAKVKYIDPSNRAITSYKLGLNTQDDKNIKDEIFDFIRMPLSIIENAPKGLDYLMKSKLEIIHLYVFYQYKANPDRLIKLNSPYLLDFIIANRRDYLWKYLLLQKDNEKVYKEIIERFSSNEQTAKSKVSNDDVIENERLQMLKIALHFARNGNASIDEINEICKEIGKVNISKNNLNVTSQSGSILTNTDEKRELFKKLDADGNGVLDRQELLPLCNNDKKFVDQIFKQFNDKNKQGLNFDEFIKAQILIKCKKNWNELFEEKDVDKKDVDEKDDNEKLDKDKLLVFFERCLENKELFKKAEKILSGINGKLDFSVAVSLIFEVLGISL